MSSQHTRRLIVACQVSGMRNTWLYLSDDPRGRYGGRDLSRMNDRAIHFVALAKIDAALRTEFDEVAEAIGLGEIDWTDLRVTEVHTARATHDARYNAVTAELDAPTTTATEDGTLLALAEACRTGAETPGTISAETLRDVAAALDQMRQDRSAVRDRLDTLEATLGNAAARESAPIWLNACPPELASH